MEKKICNKRIYDLFCSPNIQVIKSRMRGARHVHTEFCLEDLMKRNNLEDLGIDGRIILKRIFNTWGGEAWPGLLRLRIGTGLGACASYNEFSFSIKCRENVD